MLCGKDDYIVYMWNKETIKEDFPGHLRFGRNLRITRKDVQELIFIVVHMHCLRIPFPISCYNKKAIQ